MKKTLTLDLLSDFQPLIKKYQHLIRVTKPDKGLIKILDADSKSDFFFTIQERTDRAEYVVVFKPLSNAATNIATTYVPHEKTVALFNNWLLWLSNYESLEDIFQDPIEKKYRDEIVNDFQMTDEDAKYAPFDIAKLFLIEEHLEKVKAFIAEHKADFKDESVPEILEAECDITIEELPSTPKDQVIKRIANIYAKIIKSTGMSVVKKFFTSLGGEVQKQLAKVTIENLSDIAQRHGDNIKDGFDAII